MEKERNIMDSIQDQRIREAVEAGFSEKQATFLVQLADRASIGIGLF